MVALEEAKSGDFGGRLFGRVRCRESQREEHEGESE